MVHQELNQALKRNVMDNMWLGRFPKVATGIPLTSEKKMYAATKELFEKLELDVDPKTVMSKMPVSQRQMVEIAKAVSYNAKVIVFDEPTSSLTEAGGRASLPHHQHAARQRAAGSFTSRTRWRRSSAFRTKSRSCATVPGLQPALPPS